MKQENLVKNVNTLDVLLQVESKASALVTDAEQEADRRVHDSEEKQRAAYEERCRAEIHAQEMSLVKHREKVKNEYKDALDAYKRELLQVNADKEQFSVLLNKYLDNR